MSTNALRCPGPLVALRGLAQLYGVSPARLERALPAAAEAAHADASAITSTLAGHLDAVLRPPAQIVYYHGSRVLDPRSFRTRGLLPLSQRLDALWVRMGTLVPEIDTADLERLRADVSGATAEADDGPSGALIRDTLVRPADYGAHDHLRCPARVADICGAIGERFGVDAAERFKQVAVPCIVEFTRPAEHVEEAVAAAAWYVEAALRGACAGPRAHWGYAGDGVAVGADAILSIRATDGSEQEW